MIIQVCVGSSCHLKGSPEIVELLQKAVRRGWFSAGTAEKLAASSYDMLMELLHPPIKVADPRIEPVPETKTPDVTAQIPGDALCYYFGCEGRNTVRWVVAPWCELRGRCGLVMAADGSFFVNQGEWGEPRGAVVKCR